jgi:hypothetical protein
LTALDLFTWLGERIPQAIEAEFERRDCCILATRLAIEVAHAFGIHAYPISVQVVLMNAQFHKHVEEGDCDVLKWAPIDGSHSVGIGCGFHPGQPREGRWDGHLIAAAEGAFGDFAIQPAERVEKGIYTGPSLVGPLAEGQRMWTAIHTIGTVIQYKRTNDPADRFAPDWKDDKRRRRIAGPLIRQVREQVIG